MTTPDELIQSAAAEAATKRRIAAQLNIKERQAQLSLAIEADWKQEASIRLIMARAHIEAVEAFQALALADPHEPKEIAKLQGRIERYGEMTAWLVEAIGLGEDARQELDGHAAGLQDDIFTNHGYGEN